MPARALTSSATWQPHVLSVLRIVIGLLVMQHGLAKLFGFPHLAEYDHLRLFSLLGLAGVIETFGGALLVLGLFARPAAFLLSGEMAVAYFRVHAPHSPYPLLNHGGLAVIFCFVFFYLFVAGPGAWSLDRFRRGRRR